jgi:hypothetical protein
MIFQETSPSVYEVIAGLFGAVTVAIIAIGIALAHTREKVAKLEAQMELLFAPKKPP